jgi:hypothetical protein
MPLHRAKLRNRFREPLPRYAAGLELVEPQAELGALLVPAQTDNRD